MTNSLKFYVVVQYKYITVHESYRDNGCNRERIVFFCSIQRNGVLATFLIFSNINDI